MFHCQLTLSFATKAFFTSLQANITRALRLAKSKAVSKPMPVLLPVTKAVFPASFTLLRTQPPLAEDIGTLDTLNTLNCKTGLMPRLES